MLLDQSRVAAFRDEDGGLVPITMNIFRWLVCDMRLVWRAYSRSDDIYGKLAVFVFTRHICGKKWGLKIISYDLKNVWR